MIFNIMKHHINGKVWHETKEHCDICRSVDIQYSYQGMILCKKCYDIKIELSQNRSKIYNNWNFDCDEDWVDEDRPY